MLYVASITVGYLVPALGGAIDQVFELIAGDEGSRELFRSATGVAAPAWEQVVGYGSVAVMVVALPIALPIIWRRWRSSSLVLTLALISLLYPVSLFARLTARGAELAARSAEFVFVGSSFVTALAALAVLDTASGRAPADGWRSGIVAWLMAHVRVAAPRARRIATAAVMTGLIVLFMGGAVLGIPPWARQPGPYLVSADPRSVSPQGIDAATWTLGALGPGGRFLSDRTNRTLLATYGRQHPISCRRRQDQPAVCLLLDHARCGRPGPADAGGRRIRHRRPSAAHVAAVRRRLHRARRAVLDGTLDRADAGGRAGQVARPARNGPYLRQR